MKGLSPPVLELFFTIRENPYNLGNRRLETTNKNTNLYGMENVLYDYIRILHEYIAGSY